ncbi:MAG: HVO_0476 family zinc finger protein, partial [Halobacteriota archaeon]
MQADCPACGLYGEHEVLTSNGRATVECGACGHVHKVRAVDDSVDVDVVVSQGETSISTRASIEGHVAVGIERVLETEDGVYGVEVTAIDTSDGRVDVAEAEEVDTVWTRVVDNVEVPVTLHEDGTSTSHGLRVPGDYTFEVGDRETVDDT